MRRPKQDMFGLRIRIRTKAAKTIRIAVVVHFIGETSIARPVGPAARQTRRTRAVSLVAFGLFLEDRDLGFFFFFPEIVPETEYCAQRHHGQQELEEAFHRNLPSLILLKAEEKSITPSADRNFRDLIFDLRADIIKFEGARAERHG